MTTGAPASRSDCYKWNTIARTTTRCAARTMAPQASHRSNSPRPVGSYGSTYAIGAGDRTRVSTARSSDYLRFHQITNPRPAHELLQFAARLAPKLVGLDREAITARSGHLGALARFIASLETCDIAKKMAYAASRGSEVGPGAGGRLHDCRIGVKSCRAHGHVHSRRPCSMTLRRGSAGSCWDSTGF
jgi:hypothetical protein